MSDGIVPSSALNESLLDDWRLADALVSGDGLGVHRLMRDFYGGHLRDVVDATRDSSGRARTTDVFDRFIADVRVACPNILTLVTALTYHGGALRASLMGEYGLRLGELRAWPLREAADLVAWLPAGCALWRSSGGPGAWTAEERAIRELDYSVRVLIYHHAQGKGPKPKEPKHPPYAHERREADEKVRRKAEGVLRRQRRKSA